MQLSKLLLGLPVLALFLSSLPGCGGGGGGTHSSPEAVFNSFQEAAKKEDWKTFANCLTEESRDQMAGSLVMATVGMSALSELPGSKLPPEIKEALEKTGAVLKQHGLTEEKTKELQKQKVKEKEGFKKVVEPIKDKAAFIADMMKAMKKDSDKSKLQELDAKLKDVKIEGDTARGTLVFDSQGKEKTEPIEFKKESGSWRIQFPEKGPGGPMGE